MNYFKGENHQYLSVDSIHSDANNDLAANLEAEDLHSMTPSGMAPHVLNIKTNSIVMLLRNLSINHGLVNGARLRVVRFFR